MSDPPPAWDGANARRALGRRPSEAGQRGAAWSRKVGRRLLPRPRLLVDPDVRLMTD